MEKKSKENLLIEILATNADKFGESIMFKKDDIVVWKGRFPAILRIASDFKIEENGWTQGKCFRSTFKEYDSLHFSNLRIATEKEIQLLGDSEYFILDELPC